MCNLLRYKDQMKEPYAKFEFRHVRIKPPVRFKVAPSEPAPVITLREDGYDVDMLNFGFDTGKGRQLMARGETVEKLPTFREAFKHRRCLIIAHGFYDSLDMGKFKQPWHIHLKGDETMCFAGLWEERPDGENFTIVSAPANKLMSRIIDRMPVILPPELWKPWIDEDTDETELKAMLQPYPDEMMEAYPVTRKVNQRGFEGPDCIERIVPEQEELGLW